jgi:hypothetical protein
LRQCVAGHEREERADHHHSGKRSTAETDH